MSKNRFRDAGIGDAVEASISQSQFLSRREVSIIGDRFVFVASDQIENVLFQIGGRAGDGVDFVLTDHLGQRDAQFRGTHCAGQ